MLKITRLAIPEVWVLEYPTGQDHRALFYTTFSRAEMRSAGIETDFCQEVCYEVFQKDTVYGIHFQNRPKVQTKLLSCTRGRILDVAVDLRRGSPTYKHWVSVELNEDNRKQLLIPAGFGHGALTLTAPARIVMRTDRPFDPALSRAIRYDDPALGLPFRPADPILSTQDRLAPLLADSDCNL